MEGIMLKEIESMWFIKKNDGIHTPWLTMFGLDTHAAVLKQCLGTIFVGCIYGTETVAIKQCKELDNA
jgi:hypothetical protein